MTLLGLDSVLSSGDVTLGRFVQKWLLLMIGEVRCWPIPGEERRYWRWGDAGFGTG